uniref:ADAM metallopeptidase domain 9b n=1 Tax=Lepisosteus oculatus TaxID=7918 RepID=W5MNQ4_LEPOC|nr:PREDICTED: disintegrin and metalloproteinase domain-containing protein 9-like [Lepisosteus oculatus]
MLERSLFLFSFFICFINRSQATDLFAEQTSKLSSYRVVIPRVVHDREKRDTLQPQGSEQAPDADRLMYSINIEDKDHVLHLEKNKDFLAKTFVHYSYDDSGKLATSHPKEEDHCYYHGYVEGQDDSLVALSTCSGLSGIILMGQKTYGLEPVIRSSANEHLLFLLEHSQKDPFVCGVTNEMPPFEINTESHSQHYQGHTDTVESMTRMFRKKRNLPQTRYVELILVADKQMYDDRNANETALQKDMVQMANLLDGYYKQLNVRVILVGVEIWNNQNPIDVDGSAGEVLGRFVQWRKNVLIPKKKHDVGQLIVGRKTSYPQGVLGMAFVGTVCSVSSAGGINVFGGSTLQFVSTVIAHEMGHNLGMNHDDKRNCNCAVKSCIMNSGASGSTTFSSCSGTDFENLILQGRGICLKNQPSSLDIFSVAGCGNGVLDQGEQCDCGKPEDCQDKCCDAATCTFTRGSYCSQGSCCDNCQLKVAGTPCRESVNICDLPEYCIGTSPFCPNDYYIMDGYPCENNTAYCYEGRCQTYDYQCQKLFTKDANKAPNICFEDANTRGDRFGNCGMTGTIFNRCTVENALCGKIQCSGVDVTNPPFGSTITVKNIGNTQCVNVDFDLGSDVLDPGYVSRGSGCSQGKACVDFKCTNASELNFNCDIQTKCSGNGVCNNQGNCHCNAGWAPPDCSRKGSGGSIDSGPTTIDTSVRDGLLIFFLLVVPIIIIVLVLLFLFKRGWKPQCLREKRSRQYRSRNSAPTNAQRAAPQSQPQSHTGPPQPATIYPPRSSDLPPSRKDVSFSLPQYQPSETPLPVHQQGPGVPRPIPPAQPQQS